MRLDAWPTGQVGWFREVKVKNEKSQKKRYDLQVHRKPLSSSGSARRDDGRTGPENTFRASRLKGLLFCQAIDPSELGEQAT